jgi:hypothetical protein
VGGHKRSDESFRECVVREVQEELELQEGVDFRVATDPVSHLEYEAYSRGFGEQTQYTMELFEVMLNGHEAHRKIASNTNNRWLSASHIRDETAVDERPVSPTMGLLLRKAGMLPGG